MFGAGFALGSRQLASGLAGIFSTALLISVSGADETARLAPNGVNVREQLNGRMTAQLTFIEPRPSAWRPVVGAPIIVFIGSTRRFAGTIDELDEALVTQRDNSVSQIRVTCVDWNQIPQRFAITSRSYSALTAGAIVSDLLAVFLADDDILNTGVVAGPTLTTYDIKDKTVADVLTDLSEISSHIWSISPFKIMAFMPTQLSTAPFSLTASNATLRTVTMRRSRDQYRNVQTVRGEGAVLATVTNAAQITARQAIEGGSGRYERIDNDTAITTAAHATSKATGLLRRFDSVDTLIEAETERDGLTPGQRLTATFEDLDISGTFLITDVEWELLPLAQTRYRYRIKASSGEVRAPELDFWKRAIG